MRQVIITECKVVLTNDYSQVDDVQNTGASFSSQTHRHAALHRYFQYGPSCDRDGG